MSGTVARQSGPVTRRAREGGCECADGKRRRVANSSSGDGGRSCCLRLGRSVRWVNHTIAQLVTVADSPRPAHFERGPGAAMTK